MPASIRDKEYLPKSNLEGLHSKLVRAHKDEEEIVEL